VLLGAFVTALYTFRMLFMTFHGKPRWQEAAAHAAHAPVDQAAHDPHAETHPMPHGEHDTIGHEEEHDHHGGPPHESPWVVWVPLVLLAIPSIVIGLLTVQPLLFGGGFGSSIFVNEAHNVVPELHEEFGNWLQFALSSFTHPVLYLVIAGFVAAWALYIKWPHLPGVISQKLRPLVFVLENKYGFDWFNEKVLAAGGRLLGKLFWKVGDQGIIDGAAVNGSASAIDFFAGVVRRVQSGFLYSYAFWMVIGLAAMLGWFLTH
jgi:NADH-quinone oxidoreductase subunit L